MEIAEIQRLIAGGEKIDVEFKKSSRKLNRDVYDSVCAFSNRNGGDIFLGVSDDRSITGVDPDAIDKMLKDFTTAVNSTDKFYPPLYLSPQVVQIGGKSIIHIHVPEGTQVCRHAGHIYDRSYEGDLDITNNADMVFKLYARKQATYFVNRVYPHMDFSALDSAVIEKARRMTPYYNNVAHPLAEHGRRGAPPQRGAHTERPIRSGRHTAGERARPSSPRDSAGGRARLRHAQLIQVHQALLRGRA